MAELKIKADSGGGTVSLKGPATTTSNAAVQLTLPVDDGTSGQYLKTDGSGAMSWATVSTPVTALNNATANELVTVGSTTTELDAEANLTFDGTELTLAANRSNTAGTGHISIAPGDTTSIWTIRHDSTGNDLWFDRGTDASSTALIGFSHDGNIKFTSGKGIDFSATGDSTGTVSNELFDDYEEGTWDPVLYSTGGGDDFGYSSRAGYYQKVGGVVHYYCNIQWTKGGGVSSGYIYCKGFPFTTRNNPGSYYYIGSNMELGDNGSDPFVIFMANGNNTVGPFNTGGATGLTGFAETGDVGSSGSAWFSLTVFTDA